METHLLDRYWTQEACGHYPDALKLAHPYEPLFRTLRERGVAEICVTDRYGYPSCDRNHVVLPPDLQSLDRVLSLQIFWETSIAFSREADWGLASYFDGFSILAGAPEFIEHFYRNAGGERAAQLRFYWADDEGVDPMPEKLYEICGWPVPDYSDHEPTPDLDHFVLVRPASWRSEMT